MYTINTAEVHGVAVCNVEDETDEAMKMKQTKELTKDYFEKALESLTLIDEYCHSLYCQDCPFYMMDGEGECPLDKLGLGKEVYMKNQNVVRKAKERIIEYATDNDS